MVVVVVTGPCWWRRSWVQVKFHNYRDASSWVPATEWPYRLAPAYTHSVDAAPMVRSEVPERVSNVLLSPDRAGAGSSASPGNTTSPSRALAFSLGNCSFVVGRTGGCVG